MSDTAAMLLTGVSWGRHLRCSRDEQLPPMLFGLKPYDFATLAFAILLLAAIGVLASLLPALKPLILTPLQPCELNNLSSGKGAKGTQQLRNPRGEGRWLFAHAR